MNFKIAAAINLFHVLQFRSSRSLDRDRDVFFKRLYGYPLVFCPAQAAGTRAASSLPLARVLAISTWDGQCRRSMLYFCGLFGRRTVGETDHGQEGPRSHHGQELGSSFRQGAKAVKVWMDGRLEINLHPVLGPPRKQF